MSQTTSRRRRTTPDEAADAVEVIPGLYAAGATVRDIAARYGRSYGWVHRILTDAKVQWRPRGGAGRRAKTTGES